MKQPDDIFSQMLPFWEHLTPQEQMALREASVPSTLPKGTITHRADQDCKGILLLLSGQLRAFLLSEEGREVTLYRVREGETCVLSSSCLMDAIPCDHPSRHSPLSPGSAAAGDRTLSLQDRQ